MYILYYTLFTDVLLHWIRKLHHLTHLLFLELYYPVGSGWAVDRAVV